METSLIGQDAVTDILNRVIDDPPHIFITGAYGSGKTTLLREFIAAYFTKKGAKPQRESILWLSSEQDRGIHCIRQSVTEFVKHTSNTPGTYRWIVIDDADSLPIISQQALRRPMRISGNVRAPLVVHITTSLPQLVPHMWLMILMLAISSKCQ